MKHLATNKRKGFRTGTLLITVFLALYIPSGYFWLFGGNVTMDYIRHGTIEDYINTNALILRDSVVFEAPISGISLISYDEGDKVPADSTIASVLSSSGASLIDELAQKEEQVIRALSEKVRTSGTFSREISKLESEIGEKLKLVIEATRNNTFSEIIKYETEINALVQEKAGKLGDEAAADTYISSLKTEINTLKNKIDSNRKNIVSENPGIVSYILDDYEEKLSKGYIRELTPEYFGSVLSEGNPQAYIENDVEEGAAVAKITGDLSYCIAVCLDIKDAYRFEEGSKIRIRFNDPEYECNGDLIYKSSDMDGYQILAFELNKYLSETVSLRTVNVDLILSSYSGKMIPVKSLFEIDKINKTAKITLFKVNFASIREVSIIGSNKYYAIIDDGTGKGNNVELYDAYIIDPKNIVDGQEIR